MRKLLFNILLVACVILLAGVFVFKYFLDLSWIDSFYFVITTVTTVGYGDINLKETSPYVKLFGIVLMLVGSTAMACLLGLITDYIIRIRLSEIFGVRGRKMKGHIILCGLGNVGIRVLEQLVKLKEKVIVIEEREDSKFIGRAKDMKVPIIVGDMRYLPTLEKANVNEAKCIIGASSQDLSNLEAAVTAKTANENIHIVLRMFDQAFAHKIREGFGIDSAFSTSALAAPAFAMAAVDPSVKGSFLVGEDLMFTLEVFVESGSFLEEKNINDLKEEGDYAVLVHESHRTKEKNLNPPSSVRFMTGDKLMIACPQKDAKKLHQLNSTGFAEVLGKNSE